MAQKSAENDLRNEIERLLKAQPIDSVREMVRNDAELEEMAKQLGPQSKDELWQWFKDVIGIELGRVAVCPGHSCQLDILWEIYNFQVTRVLLVLSRGGGKTSSMAWLDYCQAFFFPGWESFTIGPGRNQGERKYEHLLPHVVEGGVIGGKEKEHVIRSVMTKTELKNGSKLEIALGGGVDNANGPRVPRLHRDETELMQDDTYKQAGNIPAGRKTRDGRYVPAQIVDTSTMKWAGGRIDTQMQEFTSAIEKGQRPSLEVRVSCLFEAAAENPYCRSVPDEDRRARLIELKLDPDKKCDCQTYVRDVWESDDPNVEPVDRTLESVCEGRFFRSRGYKEFTDIQTLFLENEKQTWEAEQECSEPSREGAFLKAYSQTKHGIRDYIPDPENGFIYEMVDWGGTDENFVGFFQILDRDVPVLSYKGGKRKVMPKGSFVVFREIYKADIGPGELAEQTKEIETGYVIQYPGWRIHERYPDSANSGARKDWAKLYQMPTTSRIKKDFKLEVSYVRTRVSGVHFYVDIEACPIFDKSLQAWRQEKGHEVHDWASHAMAAFRYAEHNLQVVKRGHGRSTSTGVPAAADDESDRVEERFSELDASVQVNQRMGQPMVIRNSPNQTAGMDYDEYGGSDDSPLRDETRSMEQPGSNRSTYTN
jgi:hypothetical protein